MLGRSPLGTPVKPPVVGVGRKESGIIYLTLAAVVAGISPGAIHR